MTVLADVRTDWNDLLAPSRPFDEVGLWIAGFPIVDTFEGEVIDPQSLHKYLYCNADPINNIDPSGMFSLCGLLGFSIGGIGMSIAAYSTLGLVAGYVGWSYMAPESFAQYGHPAAWEAWATGESKIQSFEAKYTLQRVGYDLDFYGERAWGNWDSPIYKDTDLHALFEAYSNMYGHVTSRRCDLALGNLVSQLKPWVMAHRNETKGIRFVEADWQRIPNGQSAQPGSEDDNLLILLPTEYARDIQRLSDPAWYDSPQKRNILYFYPGSTPVHPVGRLYENYVSGSNTNGLPKLNVHPNFSFP